MRKTIRTPLLILITALLLLGIPKLAGLVADIFDYQNIDPDGAFAWISVHHIVQAAIFLVIMALVNHIKPHKYGLGWGNTDIGKRYVLRFILFFCIYLVGSYTISILNGSFQPFAYPLTAANIIGQMGFQILLSGPSEELIFRAFAITALGSLTKKRVFSDSVSVANMIAALIFGLAHVQFSFIPFTFSFSVFQIVYAMVLGFFYGDCYEKSGSVIYPMMMHSISNALMVGSGIIISIWSAY